MNFIIFPSIYDGSKPWAVSRRDDVECLNIRWLTRSLGRPHAPQPRPPAPCSYSSCSCWSGLDRHVMVLSLSRSLSLSVRGNEAVAHKVWNCRQFAETRCFKLDSEDGQRQQLGAAPAPATSSATANGPKGCCCCCCCWDMSRCTLVVPLNRTISAQIFAESSVRSLCLTVRGRRDGKG